MTKRILHIVASLEPSGTTKQLELLAGGLRRNEFEFHIISLNRCATSAGIFQQHGIEPVLIQRRGRLDPCAFWKLRQLIRQLRPDIVHTWKSDANTYGRPAAMLAGVSRIVASERQIDTAKGSFAIALDRRLAERTNCIVFNSSAVRGYYLSRRLPPAKLRLISSGVPLIKSNLTNRGATAG